MTEHRAAKTASRLQRIIGRFLQQWGMLPRNAIVTITNVVVSPDRHYATVHVGVYPANERDDVLELLEDNVSTIQHTVNQQLQVRPVPRLRFVPDAGEEQREAIESLLREERE